MRRMLPAITALALLSFMQSSQNVKQLSLDFTSRILEKGKFLTVAGEVYFRRNDGLLTTHMQKPFENVTVVNASGEMKIHDPKENTLVQTNSAINSTETSYFWHFLNGSHNDLGYAKAGYVISGSRLEQGLMITNWVPKTGYSTPVASIELVHEKTLPIFVSFRSKKNQLMGKVYFSKYGKAGDLQLPYKITEIIYQPKGDSTVTTKTYSNLKVNAAVDEKYLSYKIPANAKLLSSK